MTEAGCVAVSVHTTGAGSLDDLTAENAYIAVYTNQLTVVHRNMLSFAATGDSPGVCNIGGSKQGCYDADAKVAAAFTAMLDALKAMPVPPRFVEADRLLRDGITADVQALELRNQAIAINDDAAWQQSGSLLHQAAAGLTAAYAAFPTDNRPAQAP